MDLDSFYIVRRIDQEGYLHVENGWKGGTGPKLYTFGGAKRVCSENNRNFFRWYPNLVASPAFHWKVVPVIIQQLEPIVF